MIPRAPHLVTFAREWLGLPLSQPQEVLLRAIGGLWREAGIAASTPSGGFAKRSSSHQLRDATGISVAEVESGGSALTIPDVARRLDWLRSP